MAPGVWKLAEWARHLEEQRRRVMRDELRRVFQKAALTGEREAKLLATSRLRRRSGRLAQSIRGKVRVDPKGDGSDVELRLSAGGGSGRNEVKYARIQELGGIVSPRRGAALAIPLGAARTAAGGLRAEFAVPGGLRGVPGLFVRRWPGGKAFLARRVGDRIELLFLLKRGGVRIRGKHYLMDGILAAQKTLPQALEKMTRIATGEGGPGGAS